MIETYSQIFQDLLALKFTNFKKNGFYVDIGCGFPSYINNTYTLEKNYGWRGISLDINDQSNSSIGFGGESLDGKSWKQLRNSEMHVIENALTVNYKELFQKHNAPLTIDFLSIDLEPPQLTLDCLYKIPFSDYQFNFIAFETDEYREGGKNRRDTSRKYIENLGYNFIGNISKQDDFYIHNTLVNEKTQLLNLEDIIANHANINLLEKINSF
jgi:hypothetical protein